MTCLLEYGVEPESAYATDLSICRQATMIGTDGEYGFAETLVVL